MEVAVFMLELIANITDMKPSKLIQLVCGTA